MRKSENRKGCLMSFPYQCLAAAILSSCLAGPTGICRLTPLPSLCTANTHMAHFLPRNTHSWAGSGSTALPLCIISGGGSASSLPSVGLEHPVLPFQVTFPQELLGSFVGNSSERPSAALCWSVCIGSALRQRRQEASTSSGNKTAG